jgi:hypothetical protein
MERFETGLSTCELNTGTTHRFTGRTHDLCIDYAVETSFLVKDDQRPGNKIAPSFPPPEDQDDFKVQ